MIRNIVFDIGNVLLDYNPRRTLSAFIGDPEVREAVYDTVFCSEAWARADAGLTDMRGVAEDATRRLPQYQALIQRAVNTWHLGMTPIPGMPEIVEALDEKGFPLYVISNFSERFYAIDEPLFRRMRGIVISADEKLVKPDVRIFQLLCTRYGLIPGECLFIDDIPANAQGARDAGMQAHCFTGVPALEAELQARGIL